MSAAETPTASAPVDVGYLRVARVYAEALLNDAWVAQKSQAMLDDLEALVGQVFAADPQLEEFLSSRAVGRDRKEKVIRDVFATRSDPLFMNFLLVLNHHDRLELVRAVLAAYRELFEKRHHRIRVEVRSAVPLTEPQAERLRGELREALRQEPVLEARVDPDLIGGLVVRAGDWLYDASVRTQLAGLQKQLIERSSHEIQFGRDRFRTPE